MSGSFALTTNQRTIARKSAATLSPIWSVTAAVMRRWIVPDVRWGVGPVIQTSTVTDHSRGTRCLQAEQLGDERAIPLRAPIVGADPLFANRALAPDDERLGITRRLQYALDLMRIIMQDLECHAIRFRERANRVLADGVVDAHRDDLQALVAVGFLQPLETRNLFLAGLAVRRPDVQQHDLTLVVGRRLEPILAEHFRAEVRHCRADRHGEEIVPHEVRRGSQPAAEQHDHQSYYAPLLSARHTATPQRPRNAPISARGSRAEKIALPATKVSAPAFQMS